MQTLNCAVVLGALLKIWLSNEHFHPKILQQLAYGQKSETAGHNAFPWYTETKLHFKVIRLAPRQ
jgi:hypothetical protein